VDRSGPPGAAISAALARRAALLALVWLAPAAARAEGDPWLGRDKAVHFAASAVLARSASLGAGLVLERPRDRALVGAGVSLTLGALKELYDLTGRGDPSAKDLAWDALGTLVGVGVAWVLDRLFRSDPRWTQVLGG